MGCRKIKPLADLRSHRGFWELCGEPEDFPETWKAMGEQGCVLEITGYLGPMTPDPRWWWYWAKEGKGESGERRRPILALSLHAGRPGPTVTPLSHSGPHTHRARALCGATGPRVSPFDSTAAPRASRLRSEGQEASPWHGFLWLTALVSPLGNRCITCQRHYEQRPLRPSCKRPLCASQSCLGSRRSDWS